MDERDAYRKKPHDFQTAPPGQGRAQVCTKCGIRQPLAGDSSCGGINRNVTIETVSDYDPV